MKRIRFFEHEEVFPGIAILEKVHAYPQDDKGETK